MSKIGITTTVPVEVIFAAGQIPVDLNNIFITHPQSSKLVDQAELAGYPRNLCGWIKGLYSTILAEEEIDTLVAVTQGDCSNTHALMETLQLKGIKTIPFSYPFDRDKELLELQIDKLIKVLGTSWEAARFKKEELDEIRARVHYLDELTWKNNLVSGLENHLYQVSCSDFFSEPRIFSQELDKFLTQVESRTPYQEEVRLGFIGVPPIITDLYQYIEELGGRVVFNEVQRQFSMPYKTADLVEQYRMFTYPYDIFGRIEDIQQEIKKRKIKGIIHYTQSFCFRQIEDLIIREKLDVPVLTLEGDRPGPIDARSKIRLESFLELFK